jgi:hypothetical protein
VYALDFREYVCNSKHKRNVLSKEDRDREIEIERERAKNFVCFYFG